MNNPSRYIAVAVALAGVLQPAVTHGQGSLGDGTFQDLDFSEADVEVVGGNGFTIEAGPALPGWTASIGGIAQSSIFYNNSALSGGCISLWGPTQPSVCGNYSVFLQGGAYAWVGAASIQQTGIVPAGANSIQFQSRTYPFYPQSINTFGLNINGQPVNLVPLSGANTAWTYGANISQYAGQSATLNFFSFYGSANENLWLSDITFSIQVIPEPSVLGLFGIGGLIFGWSARGKWVRAIQPFQGCELFGG